MKLHDMPRGTLCGFMYWSSDDGCWKKRVAVVMKKGRRPDGTPKTLCKELDGEWKCFLEPHVKDLKQIELPLVEVSSNEAQSFARTVEKHAPEIPATAARMLHGCESKWAVFASVTQEAA